MGRKGLVGEYKNNNKKEKKRKEKNSWAFNWGVGEDKKSTSKWKRLEYFGKIIMWSSIDIKNKD